MGFTDLLKTRNQPKIIQEDGKEYEFTPGENGSLIVRKPKPTPLPPIGSDVQKRAKIVPMSPDDKQQTVDVGSVRG